MVIDSKMIIEIWTYQHAQNPNERDFMCTIFPLNLVQLISLSPEQTVMATDLIKQFYEQYYERH